VPEFDPCVGGCEVPVGFGVSGIAVVLPGDDFVDEGLFVAMRRSRHWDDRTPSSQCENLCNLLSQPGRCSFLLRQRLPKNSKTQSPIPGPTADCSRERAILGTTLDDLARASFPAHMGRAISCALHSGGDARPRPCLQALLSAVSWRSVGQVQLWRLRRAS
jgi:hypothetical protein